MQAQGFTPDQISLNVLIGALLTNWVDSGRSPHSDLLAKADDVFHRGWATGVTRPLKHATGTTRLMRFDLHCQGTWSAQLALLAILAEIAQDAMRGVLPPALMLITGQGLKKGVAPLRETVRQLLVRMGMSVRVALGNEGTVIVPHGALVRAVKRSVRGDRPFDVFHWHEALVDPRTAKRGSGES